MKVLIEYDKQKKVLTASYQLSKKIFFEGSKEAFKASYPGFPAFQGSWCYRGLFILGGMKQGKAKIRPEIFRSETKAHLVQRILLNNKKEAWQIFRILLPWTGILSPCWASYECEQKGCRADGLLYPSEKDVATIKELLKQEAERSGIFFEQG